MTNRHMSKDRIHFKPIGFSATRRDYDPKNRTNYQEATYQSLIRAMGMTPGAADNAIRNSMRDPGYIIVCRPSQFGRFIAHRASFDDITNNIRSLHPVIVEPEPVPSFVDVSANPNKRTG